MIGSSRGRGVGGGGGGGRNEKIKLFRKEGAELRVFGGETNTPFVFRHLRCDFCRRWGGRGGREEEKTLFRLSNKGVMYCYVVWCDVVC